MKTLFKKENTGKLITYESHVSLILHVSEDQQSLLFFDIRREEIYRGMIDIGLIEEVGIQCRITTDEDDIKSFIQSLVKFNWDADSTDSFTEELIRHGWDKDGIKSFYEDFLSFDWDDERYDYLVSKPANQAIISLNQYIKALLDSEASSEELIALLDEQIADQKNNIQTLEHSITGYKEELASTGELMEYLNRQMDTQSVVIDDQDNWIDELQNTNEALKQENNKLEKKLFLSKLVMCVPFGIALGIVLSVML